MTGDMVLAEVLDLVSQLGYTLFMEVDSSSAPSTDKGLSQQPRGPTPRPLGEKVAGHAGMSGEVSPAPLANRVQQDPPLTPVDGALEKPTSKLVRATSKYALEPWRLVAKEHRPKSCTDEACPSCGFYRSLARARDMSTTGANVAARAHWRADSATLDAFRLEHGRGPRKGEWPFAKLNTYEMIRKAVPSLGGGIASAISHHVVRKWNKERFDALVKEDRSPPHYRKTGPISLRAADVTVRQVPGGIRLEFSLSSRPHARNKEFSIPLHPRDERQAHELAQLASGAWQHGEIALQQDRLRKHKWYVRVAYKRLAPVVPASERIAAINRGMVAFLVAVTYDPTEKPWRYDGHDIEAYLKQMQRRRQHYQYDSKASSRDGHGRARIMRPLETLQGRAERWRQTKCQTIARRFARWCEERKISKVKIEDFSGIRDGLPERLEGGKFVWDRIQEWPYFQLETRIASCLEEVGIAVERVPAHFISQRCPSCGDVRPENTDLRRRRLKCQACGWSRNLDVAAAMNVLIRERSGGDESDSAGNGSGAKGRNGTARKPRGKSWKGNGSSGTGPQS